MRPVQTAFLRAADLTRACPDGVALRTDRVLAPVGVHACSDPVDEKIRPGCTRRARPPEAARQGLRCHLLAIEEKSARTWVRTKQ